MFHRQRSGDTEERARGGLLPDTGFVDEVNERSRAAIHDGHFRGVELHDGIIDTERPEGREKVLHRLDPRIAVG